MRWILTNILVQCLICFITLICINAKAINADVIRHEIRGDIWPIKNIRRVTGNLETYTYFNSSTLGFKCNELNNIMASYYKDNKNNETVNFGKICNKLVSLINFKEMKKVPYFKEYTAAHESFHLAVQIFGNPFAYGVEVVTENDYAFIDDFTTTFRNSISNSSCRLITDYLDKISKNKKNYLLFKAMYEWPAEYYAKKIYFDEKQDYLSFRNSLTEQSKDPNKWYINSLYILSDEVITNLEANTQTSNWKQRVNNGESIVDIYLKNNGCKTYSDSWPKGTINEYNLYR